MIMKSNKLVLKSDARLPESSCTNPYIFPLLNFKKHIPLKIYIKL